MVLNSLETLFVFWPGNVRTRLARGHCSKTFGRSRFILRTLAAYAKDRVSRPLWTEAHIWISWTYHEKPGSGRYGSLPSERRPPLSLEAVEIIAIAKQTDKPDQILLVVQYRPPLNKYCVEFPGGTLKCSVQPRYLVIRSGRSEWDGHGCRRKGTTGGDW